MLDALIVAPHPDDAELSMGGTIVRLINQGWSIGVFQTLSAGNIGQAPMVGCAQTMSGLRTEKRMRADDDGRIDERIVVE